MVRKQPFLPPERASTPKFWGLDPDGVRFFNDFIVRGFCLSRMVDPDTGRGRNMAMRFRQQSFAQISVAVQNSFATLLHQDIARRHPRDFSRVIGLSSRATFHRMLPKRSRTKRRAQERATADGAAELAAADAAVLAPAGEPASGVEATAGGALGLGQAGNAVAAHGALHHRSG